jgi:hypothetical protein
MATLRHLLQAADPVSHESPQRKAPRDRIRRIVVAATNDPFAASHGVGRRPFVVTTAAAALTIVAIGIIGARVWSPRLTTLHAAVCF